MNITHEGEIMPAYYGQLNTSCALDRCLARVHDMIDWDNKYPCRDMGNGKIRAVGMGMAMQARGITSMDVGSATLKVNDEAFTRCSSARLTWAPAVIPRLRRSRQRCLSVRLTTLPR